MFSIDRINLLTAYTKIRTSEWVNKKLDLLYYDGLHPQKKQGHP